MKFSLLAKIESLSLDRLQDMILQKFFQILSFIRKILFFYQKFQHQSTKTLMNYEFKAIIRAGHIIGAINWRSSPEYRSGQSNPFDLRQKLSYLPVHEISRREPCNRNRVKIPTGRVF